MNEQLVKEELFLVHFDVFDREKEVEEHSLALETFVVTAQSVEEILKDFNEKFFEGKFEIQVFVLPPEDGSFLKKLLVKIKKLGWAATTVVVVVNQTAQFLDTTIGKALFKRVFEHEPTWFIENFGKSPEASKKIIQGTKNFLENPNDELTKNGIKVEDLPKSFAARNRFYKACQENKKIRAIEFCNEGNFPIKKADFVNYLTKDSEKKLPPEEKIHQVFILQPVIKKRSQTSKKGRKPKELKWVSQCVTSDEELRFFLDDLSFAEGLKTSKYKFKENEEDVKIIALFEYQEIEINGILDPKKTEIKCKKVYQFNETEIEKLPENSIIETVENKFKTTKKPKNVTENQEQNSPVQMNLFS